MGIELNESTILKHRISELEYEIQCQDIAIRLVSAMTQRMAAERDKAIADSACPVDIEFWYYMTQTEMVVKCRNRKDLIAFRKWATRRNKNKPRERIKGISK